MTENTPPDQQADDLGLPSRYARGEVERVADDEAANKGGQPSRHSRTPQAGPEPEAGQ
jgi:hypothetical protein